MVGMESERESGRERGRKSETERVNQWWGGKVRERAGGREGGRVRQRESTKIMP